MKIEASKSQFSASFVKWAILAAFLAFLPACSTAPGEGSGITLTAPRSFSETLVYGYRTNALVRRSAASALQAGVISKSDAQHVLDTTNTVRSALDEARKAGCPALTKEPQDGDKPACLEGLPDSTVGKLRFAVGLADQAFGFLKALGVK